MSKFKRGDRVRLIRDFNHSPRGRTGTALEDFSVYPFVKWDDSLDGDNPDGTNAVDQEDLELIIPEQLTPEICKEKAMEHLAIFPGDDAERQKYAVGTFICEFFPHAIAELARFSYEMQQKHNPDAPMGWAKDKSVGDGNQIFRHQMDGEYREVAWRGLEQLERLLTKMPPFDEGNH